MTTGVRRTGHGLTDEHRWDVFWDAPLNHAEEVRRFQASYHADRCEVKTDGARLEISFPGLTMGSFSGDLQFTVYRGTNLLRLEAIAKTDEPSVAYIYQGGLKGFSADLLPRVLWHDVLSHPQSSRGLERRGREADRPEGTEPACGRRGQERLDRILPATAPVLLRPRAGGEPRLRVVPQGRREDLLRRHPPGGKRRGLQPGLDREGLLALQRPARHLAADAGLLLREPRRRGRLSRFGHGVHARRPLQAVARLQDHGDAFPHGVHAGVDGFREPRHHAAVDPDDARDGRQHRPHLRLPRRRPSPRPRPAPAEGAGELLRGLPPPLRRRFPHPAGRGSQRLPGRPLQHPLPQAGLLDARPGQGPAARRRTIQGTGRSITPGAPKTSSS